MLNIHLDNPYYETTIHTKDLTAEDWKSFYKEYQKGDKDIIGFTDIEGKFITLNPRNFASIQVSED